MAESLIDRAYRVERELERVQIELTAATMLNATCRLMITNCNMRLEQLEAELADAINDRNRFKDNYQRMLSLASILQTRIKELISDGLRKTANQE